MPVITSIKPQKKKQQRFNIFLDGKFAFSLSAEALAQAGLHENQEIPPNDVRKLINESEFALIFDKILKFLSFRPRSEFEINEYMLRKGVGEQTRKMVLEKLKSLQLIDDKAFTKWWVEQRSGGRPAGVRLVRFELRRKGIDRQAIDEQIAEARGSGGDEILAEKVAVKKLKRIMNLPKLEIRKKLYSALGLRGFSSEIIEKVIDKLLKKE